MRTIALVGAVLCTDLVLAQFTAHPIDNLNSSTSQNIPFAGNNASWDEARSQFLFLAPYLPTTGGAITGLGLVPNVTYATPYERFEIWMDHTTNSTLSTTFANNLTSPVLVYQLPSPGSIPWVGNTWNTLPLTTPFVYDGTSNLVIEVRKKIDRVNNPPATAVSHRVLVYPRRADLPVPIWAYGAQGSGAVDAPVASTSYNTQVLMRLQWAGPRTVTIDSTRGATSTNYYFGLNQTFTVTTRGLPGEFYFAAISFGLNPVGFPVPPIQGEVWLAGAAVLGTGILDPSGLGSNSALIPNNGQLVGTHFYCQSLPLGTPPIFTNVVDGIVNAQ